MTEHAVVLQGHLPLALGEWPGDAGACSALSAVLRVLVLRLMVPLLVRPSPTLPKEL